MSKTDFEAFVKRQQAEAKAEEARGFDPKQQLHEWLGYLDSLYKQIEGFLHAYLDAHTATITLRDVQLNEEFIGAYTAPMLTLTIGRSMVTFTPIGTMLIGTKGRVDVKGPLGVVRLALVNKKITNARQLIQVRVTIDGDSPAPPTTARQAINQIEWAWKISTPPPDMKFMDLTEDTFFDMILAVANG